MASSPMKPNFLIILADDLGFSDVGCFGSEIRTPNLDKLASRGSRFLNFHTAAACSPTRSMLLTGTDNHIAGLGAMAEQQKEKGGEKWKGQPGHEGYLNDRVAALSEVLQDNGYHTIMSGKWHLGLDLDKTPKARGFNESFSMLSGCHNHYAWEPQFQDPTKPVGDELVFKNFCPAIYSKRNMYNLNGVPHDVPTNYPLREEGFYSTKDFTAHLLDSMAQRRQSPELSSKPFFAYLAYTAPHWPLQAPKHARDTYKGRYDAGPNALRAERLQRLIKMGLVEENATAHPLVNPLGITEWEDMTADEKAKSARSMEVYAAMVETIDANVGRVLGQLEKDGEMDNTFVIFMSDNGAEGASYEAFPFLGDSVMGVIDEFYDNSLQNIGEPNSFVWYGSLWAQAATAPSRLYKMFPTQGGVRVPFIVHYPPLHKSQRKLAPNSTNDTFTTVMDLMPTILDLAGIVHPTDAGQLHRGRAVEAMRGKSWKRWIEGAADEVHAEGVPHGWELHGRAGLRIGDWKMIWMPPPYGSGKWELYDLSADPGETKDVATANPEKMRELTEAWEEYVKSSGVIWGQANWESEGHVADEMDEARAWMKSSTKLR